ncbi:MAG: tetratricopeptide repeat protein [Candidatus Lindowbacteria bacterium]|nr:tetratricopeptide repeat protein [Candidatus Lindowbacteria bacterium]
MKRSAGFAILLCILVCAVFANTLRNDFVFDDISTIKNNPAIRSAKYVRLYFLRPFFSVGQPASGPVAYDYYRPMVLLSFFADHRTWGLAPLGYHLTNILLHGVATILVFLLLDRLRIGAVASFIAAALFAAHPALADSVAGVSGRSDPLCAIFFLTCCICYMGSRQSGSRKGFLFLFLSCAALALALLTKENAIAVPLVLTAYEFIRPDGSSGGRFLSRAKSLAPIYCVAVAYFLWRSQVVPASVSFHGGVAGLALRLMTAGQVSVSYARAALLPYNLAFETFTPLASSVMTPRVLVAALLLFLAVMAAIKSRKNSPRVSFFILWFFICLLPYLYFFLFHPEPSFFTPPHFLYFPVIVPAALCGLLVTSFARFGNAGASARRKAALAAAPMFTLLFFCAQTVLRNTQWRDEFTFFSEMVRRAPASPRIRIGMGSVLLNAGRPGEALGEYGKAYELAYSGSEQLPAVTGGKRGGLNISNFYAALALEGMGDAYGMIGETGNAVYSYKAALSENSFDAKTTVKLARAYDRSGRFDEAIEFYTRGLRLDRRLFDAASSLGVARVKKEVYDEAKRVYTIALLSGKTDSVDSLYCEALMLRLSGKPEAAADLLRKALEKSPAHFGANLALGQILSQQGEYDAALGNLSVSYAVKPESAVAAYEMAITKLALRDTVTATMWAARAYELEPDDFYGRFLENIRKRKVGGAGK